MGWPLGLGTKQLWKVRKEQRQVRKELGKQRQEWKGILFLWRLVWSTFVGSAFMGKFVV